MYIFSQLSLHLYSVATIHLRNIRSDPSTTCDLHPNFSYIQHSKIAALDCTFKDLRDQPTLIVAERYLETEETVIIQFAGIVLELPRIPRKHMKLTKLRDN